MSIKVSIVVPVYNPGLFIEPTIDSLLAQTMSVTELELIFVDDGSTDDTPARLANLASTHDHVSIITIPNSGWPGKPRNIGTEAAHGEFVMYVDQDDRLDPESLQRMYDLGATNGADIILGKVTSDFRGVHQYLYRKQRPRCTVYDALLINSQTPHKMLRRQFLLDNGIRYPEGRRRLEDQLFITRAYFAARRCSVVADYVCYRYLKRPDGGNAGERRIDPPSYYDNLRDVLDVVDAHTEPGPERDHFYRRFLRVEMLGKLSGRKVIKTRLERGDIWLVPIRRLAEERFPTSVDAGLPATTRVRAHLMRHGTFADVKELTSRTRRVQPDVRLTATTARDGAVRLAVAGELVVDGVPLTFEPDGASGWLLPESLTGPNVDPSVRRIDDPAAMVADLVVISRVDGDEWFVDHPLTVSIEARGDGAVLRIAGEVDVDHATAAGGRPLTNGQHDLSVRLDVLGLNRLKPLKVDVADTGRSTTIAVLGSQPRTLLSAERSGRVTLAIGVSSSTVRQRIGPVTASWEQGRVVVELGTDWFAPSRPKLELRSERDRVVALPLTAAGGQHRIWRSPVRAVVPGRYRVRVLVPRSGAVEIDDLIVVPRTPASVLGAVTRRAPKGFRRLLSRKRVARSGAGQTMDREVLAEDEGGR